MTRIRWYHFYLLLASFDVLVIAGGLWLQVYTLGVMRNLVNRINTFNLTHRALASMRAVVVELNAPGNDVFKSGHVAQQRERFARALLRADTFRRHPLVDARSSLQFWDTVDSMCGVERRIFDLLEAVDLPTAASAPAQRSVPQAARMMADMDAYQAVAIELLNNLSKHYLDEEMEILQENHNRVHTATLGLWAFAGALAAAMTGMLWYGRKLQKTDEALVAEHQRVERERRERLAAIGELCSAVAHGIQNPLAAIRSSAELIIDLGHIDAESRQRATDVISECMRLSTRVLRLLHFARAGGQSRRPVDVNDVVRQVMGEIQPRFDECGIQVQLSGSPGAMKVQADPEEVASVLIELLSNALDHSPRGSQVQVRCRPDAAHVVIDVADRGSGVPPAARPHIFDLFYTTKPGGTGIGLASAKRIAESLGGELSLVEAEDHVGAVFRLRLPIVTG